MSRPRGVRRLFRLRFGERWAEDSVDEEIEHHIEERAEELVEAGMRPDEARRTAEEAFGDRGRYRRQCIDEQRKGARMTWWRELFDAAVADGRHAIRGMVTAPGYALAIVLTLGIGIGANAAIFTVVDATILKPIDFASPEELHLVQQRYLEEGYLFPWVTAEGAEAWQAEESPLERVGFNARARVTGEVGDRIESLAVQALSPGLIDLLGAAPTLGRAFTVADVQDGVEPVAILSDVFWTRAFGRQPDVVGRSVALDGVPHRVIGVMPRRFRFPTFSVTDLWVPLREDWTAVGQRLSQIQVTVRIPEPEHDVTLDQVHAYADAVQETGVSGEGWTAELSPLNAPSVQGNVERALWITFAAVGLMLLVALVNGINLTLARGTSRGREIGVRLALGGSRRRVAAQLFAESLVLALLAGVAAAAFAYAGVEALLSIAPQDFTTFASRPVEVDGRGLAFTGGMAVLVGLAFGLLPALHAVTGSNATSTTSLGAYGSSTRGYHRFRSALVAGQVALSLVVLFGAGLLGRSFYKLVSVDPGFDVENLGVVAMSLSPTRYPSSEEAVALAEGVTERIRAISSVTEAVYSMGTPPGTGITFGDGLWMDGHAEPVIEGDVYLPFASGHADLAQVLGVRLRAGRLFTADDDPAAGLVLVDEELADALGGVREALGQRFGLDDGEGARRFHVVGVIDDFKAMGPDDRFGDFGMIALSGTIRGYVTVVFRTDGPTEAVFPTVRDIVAQLDPGQPIQALQTVDETMAESVSRPRFFLTLMLVFSALAVTLASIGLYGVLSFAVSQRTREMGIRVALGAEAGRVRQLVLRGGLTTGALGVAMGVAGALASARVLEALLFQTRAYDYLVLGVVSLLMLGVAALASWMPAARATRVDPVRALKAD